MFAPILPPANAVRGLEPSVTPAGRPLSAVFQLEPDGRKLRIDIGAGEGRSDGGIIEGNAFAPGKAVAVFRKKRTPAITDDGALPGGEVAVGAAGSRMEIKGGEGEMTESIEHA